MIRLFEEHHIRNVRELDGMWEFCRKEALEGTENFSAEKEPDSPAKAEAARKFTLPVPGCWEQHPELLTYRGKGEYRRRVWISKDTAVRLVFKGVSHTARVFWDGALVAEHYNAYTPFEAVLPYVKGGWHELMIEADNRFSEASALHVPNDYYTYGGIIRPVAVEEISQVYLERVYFTPEYADGEWCGTLQAVVKNIGAQAVRFRVDFGLENEKTGETVNIMQVDLSEKSAGIGEASVWKKEKAAETGTSGQIEGTAAPGEEVTVELKAVFPGVESWSPENPKLYLLEGRLSLCCDAVEGNSDGKLKADKQAESKSRKDTVVAEAADEMQCETVDDLIERVGFRIVEVKDDRILLNGSPVFMKGFNRHEDDGVTGCAIPPQLMARDLDMIQDMGANAVRTCHYPNDERFLDLCDERGILVWEENHARGFNQAQMENPNFDRQCEDCIREMIVHHYNHPAIVIWGILNECASETEVGRVKYARQYAQVRGMDQTRPVTSATCRHFTDICLDLPDVVSVNMYSGWYQDVDVKQAHEKEMDWIAAAGGAGKPVIISEFGAGAMYGYRDRGRSKWSEERQADILRENMEVYLNDQRLSGIFIWQFADCRVTEENNWFAARARCHNNKGVVDEFRRPKIAYDVVKECFEKRRS
ncbi:MAG: hypothetical protein LUC95_10900 [Lachnospiraceae bacterium]|nr:hypothetical protein [Lachnospiraceae bacterium]